MNFRYTGKAADGREVAGQRAARDQMDLGVRLLQDGVYLESARVLPSSVRLLYLLMARQSEITRAIRQLHILTESKLPILEAIDLVTDQTRDRTLAHVLSDIRLQVEAGQPIADSFATYGRIFGEDLVSMIEAGETSGQLDCALDRIARHREKREEVARMFRSAMTYPLLVVVVAVMVLCALVVYVIPVFASMYRNFGLELPGLTQTILSANNMVRSYWSAGLAVVVLVFLGSVLSAATGKLPVIADTILLKAPGIRLLYNKLLAARFSRTLGELLTAGVEIILSVQIATRTINNRTVTEMMHYALLSLAEGKSLTESLEQVRLFPRPMLRMIASGEKSGQLGAMLLRAADYYDNETNNALSTLTTLAEPVIILFLGAVIAFLLVAMYLPLFDLVGGV